MVVLSSTFDPEWRGWWTDAGGDRRPAEVVKVLGGWQGVAVPGPGRWTLNLEYPGRAVRDGLAVASLAWSVWGMAYGWLLVAGRWRPGRPVAAIGPEGGS